MRVTIINFHFSEVKGGSELQCKFIAEGLEALGDSVCYIAPHATNLDGLARREIAASEPYDLHWVNCRKRNHLVEAILRSQPDVVYWRFNKRCFGSVAKALESAGVPLVFAVSHINDLIPWSTKPMEGRLKIYRQLREKLRNGLAHRGFKFVRAVTVNNPLHLEFSPVPVSKVVLNGMTDKSTDFAWGRPYCAWVSNIKPAKQPEAAVAVAKVLADQGIDLLMVGKISSGGYPQFEDPRRLPHNVFYLGERPFEEVNGILKNALLHIHTCLPEGFSNVFLQAWLHGVPSVSLNFDPGNVLVNRKLGVYADLDEGLFAREILGLLEDDAKRLSFGKRSRQYALQNHSVDALVSAVRRVLCHAANDG